MAAPKPTPAPAPAEVPAPTPPPDPAPRVVIHGDGSYTIDGVRVDPVTLKPLS
jgi:hypothetical protein